MAIFDKLMELLKSVPSSSNRYEKWNSGYNGAGKVTKWSGIRNEDEFKREEQVLDLRNVRIFFKNGIIVDVYPDVYNYFKARDFFIDGIAYNSYDIESIKQIPVPVYLRSNVFGTPVYHLEYILQRRATEERKNGNLDLSYCLAFKSLELMKASNGGYTKENYMRVVYWLWEDGRFDEADLIESDIRRTVPHVFNIDVIKTKRLRETLDKCRTQNVDYIRIKASRATCDKCSAYSKRVFCISGNDKRFPKFPDFIIKNGTIHEGCSCSYFPFYMEISMMDDTSNNVDLFSLSNRPYVAERTPDDIKAYHEYLARREGKDDTDRLRKPYYILKNKYPDMMPKSYSAFMKMKNLDSKKYQAIKELAVDLGLDI